MGFSLKKIAKSLQPAKLIKNTLKSAGEINAVGFGAVAQGVTAFGGVVKAGTQIVRDNPELTGLATGAMGLPSMGGFSGGGSASMPDAGYTASAAPGGPSSAGFPAWGWLAIAGGAVLALVLILRRK